MNPVKTLREIRLGRGDYIAGGACTEPFLIQDGARRIRPLVFGEVWTGADDLVKGMFPDRSSDPVEWAVMWKELGMDGICFRTEGMDSEDIVPIVTAMVSRTGLPIAVSGSPLMLEACAEAVTDSTMILIGNVREEMKGRHVVAAPLTDGRDIIHIRGRVPYSNSCKEALNVRRRALSGECGDAPILFDATTVWKGEFKDAHEAMIVESQAALAAMIHGADIVILRGPAAADMALLYGEDLADL